MALVGAFSSTQIIGRPVSLESANRPFTLTGWFRWPSASSAQSFFHSALCNRALGTTYSGLLIYYSGTGPTFGVVPDEKDNAGTENYIFNYYGTNTTSPPSTNELVNNTWYFGAAIYTGLSSRSAYTSQYPIAGVTESLLTSTGTNAASTYDTFCNGQVPFLGSDIATSATDIAEVCWFGSALSLSQLQYLAQYNNPLSLQTGANLISYYPLRGNLQDYGPAGIGLGDLGTSATPIAYTDHPSVIIPISKQYYLFGNSPDLATGVAALSTISLGGTATQTNAATGVLALSTVAAGGTATQTNAATGTIALATPTPEGTATQTNAATGALALSTVGAGGTATQTNAATGTLALANVAPAGTASQTNLATGAVALPAVSAQGTAVSVNYAAGSIPLGAVGAGGLATLGPLQAAGTMPLNPTGFGGTAISGQAGSGAISLATPGFAGAATQLNQAAGAVTLSPVSFSGLATQVNRATGVISLADVGLSGQSVLVIAAMGVITLPGVGLGGIASNFTTFYATGALGLHPIQFSGQATFIGSILGDVVTFSADTAGVAFSPDNDSVVL